MGNSVYKINKGIGKPIEFKGLKAQYIWYLGGLCLALLILFAGLYIIGVNTFVCLGLNGVVGGILATWIFSLSNKYGEYGIMKKLAQRSIPDVVKSYSRKAFFKK